MKDYTMVSLKSFVFLGMTASILAWACGATTVQKAVVAAEVAGATAEWHLCLENAKVDSGKVDLDKYEVCAKGVDVKYGRKP